MGNFYSNTLNINADTIEELTAELWRGLDGSILLHDSELGIILKELKLKGVDLNSLQNPGNRGTLVRALIDTENPKVVKLLEKYELTISEEERNEISNILNPNHEKDNKLEITDPDPHTNDLELKTSINLLNDETLAEDLLCAFDSLQKPTSVVNKSLKEEEVQTLLEELAKRNIDLNSFDLLRKAINVESPSIIKWLIDHHVGVCISHIYKAMEIDLSYEKIGSPSFDQADAAIAFSILSSLCCNNDVPELGANNDPS